MDNLQGVPNLEEMKQIPLFCTEPDEERNENNEALNSVPLTEAHPNSPQKIQEVKKSYLTINTCLDPPTPIGKQEAKEPPKAASTKSHLRSRQQSMMICCPGTQYANHTESKGASSVTCKKQSMPKHFVFSECLFNPQLPSSSNRPVLIAKFLIQKLGETVFQQARAFICSFPNPRKLLEEDPDKLVAIIGESNKQYIQAFKFLIGPTGATPIHNQQSHLRTKSMQPPEETQNFLAKLGANQKLPYSTRSTETKPKIGGIQASKRLLTSPANSSITDVSSPATTPIDHSGERKKEA